jgi:hypothetical protein
MRSYEYYVEAQVARAKADGAPPTALYERDGKWVTFSDLKSETTKSIISDFVSNMENR